MTKAWWGGLVVALGLMMPTCLHAEGIGFRNDLKIPITVQGASMVNNMLKRGQPILIQPGKTCWDNNLSPGYRYITIYDANQPSRVLLRDRIQFQGRDLQYLVKPVPGTKDKVKIELKK